MAKAFLVLGEFHYTFDLSNNFHVLKGSTSYLYKMLEIPLLMSGLLYYKFSWARPSVPVCIFLLLSL